MQACAKHKKRIHAFRAAAALRNQYWGDITEAQQAQSKADFVSKLSIALKEASETKYWIRLLHATEYLSAQEYQSICADCTEIEKILVASIKTAKAE